MTSFHIFIHLSFLSSQTTMLKGLMINISRFVNSITEYTMKNWKIVLEQEL